MQLGINKTICRLDDDGKADDDGDGISDELEEVGAVLYAHCQQYSLLFNLYCKAVVEIDDGVQSMSLNGWTEFTETCRIATKGSKACKRSDLDSIFVEVDARAAAESKEQDDYNKNSLRPKEMQRRQAAISQKRVS